MLESWGCALYTSLYCTLKVCIEGADNLIAWNLQVHNKKSGGIPFSKQVDNILYLRSQICDVLAHKGRNFQSKILLIFLMRFLIQDPRALVGSCL